MGTGPFQDDFGHGLADVDSFGVRNIIGRGVPALVVGLRLLGPNWAAYLVTNSLLDWWRFIKLLSTPVEKIVFGLGCGLRKWLEVGWVQQPLKFRQVWSYG